MILSHDYGERERLVLSMDTAAYGTARRNWVYFNPISRHTRESLERWDEGEGKIESERESGNYLKRIIRQVDQNDVPNLIECSIEKRRIREKAQYIFVTC